MNQRGINFGGSLVADDQAAVVLEPGVRPLNNPSALVPAQRPAILVGCDGIVGSSRDDGFDASVHQGFPGWVTIVSPICNQALGGFPRAPGLMGRPHSNRFQSGHQQLYLRRGRRVHVKSERSTPAINQYHKLCSLAPLRLADFGPPFFALAKVPSTKHSFQRICPRWFNWARKARHIFSKTLFFVQFCSRRWTVLLAPYRGGNSLHGAPVHKIHRIPSKHLRSSAGGRPPTRSFLRHGFLRTGSCSWTRAHCFSVSFLHATVSPLFPGEVKP